MGGGGVIGYVEKTIDIVVKNCLDRLYRFSKSQTTHDLGIILNMYVTFPESFI